MLEMTSKGTLTSHGYTLDPFGTMHALCDTNLVTWSKPTPARIAHFRGE